MRLLQGRVTAVPPESEPLLDKAICLCRGP
jgi:hypothetical protein